uniref:Uncharacterized protein n=1 Tax=Solanum tuberosum TaxID=4113 RepID=M1CEE2_SOLTU
MVIPLSTSNNIYKCITIFQMLLLQNDQLSIFRRTAISHTANTVGISLSTMHSKVTYLNKMQRLK